MSCMENNRLLVPNLQYSVASLTLSGTAGKFSGAAQIVTDRGSIKGNYNG